MCARGSTIDTEARTSLYLATNLFYSTVLDTNLSISYVNLSICFCLHSFAVRLREPIIFPVAGPKRQKSLRVFRE